MHGSFNTRRRFLKNSFAGLGFLSFPSSLQRSDIKLKVATNTVNEEYSDKDNYPLFPKQIFLLDDNGTPLYKKSMFSRFIDSVGTDINLITTNTDRKVIEINEPTYIRSSDVGNSGRLILNKMNNLDKIIYKDVSFIKGISTDKNGSTVKIMSLGDSLTEGGGGLVTSPNLFIKTKTSSV